LSENSRFIMSKFITTIVCIIVILLKEPQETWDLGIQDELQRSNILELIGNYVDIEASSIPGIYEYQSAHAYDSWLNWSEQDESQTVLNNNNDEASSNLIPGNYVYVRNSRLNGGDEPNVLNNDNDEEPYNPIPGSYVYIEEEDDGYSEDSSDNVEEEIPSDNSSSDEDDRDSWDGLQTDWSEQDDNADQEPRVSSMDGSYERNLDGDEPNLVAEATDEEDDEEERTDCGERGLCDNDGGIWDDDYDSSSDDDDDRDSWDGLPSDGGFI